MKKILFALICILLVAFTFVLSSCDSDETAVSGEGEKNPSNQQNNKKAVSISTTPYFSHTIGGVQSSTDKYYCGEGIFMYIRINATNSSSTPQSVKMTITVDNAKCLTVTEENVGNSRPKIEETSTIGGEVVTISDISFTVDANDTTSRELIFKIIPSKACEGYITIQYSGNVAADSAVSYKKYTFLERENLDQIQTPIITPNEDGLYWTESPISNVDEKLYIVQILNSFNEQVFLSDNYTFNYLKLSDIPRELLPNGSYTLKVVTRGDEISTKNSQAQTFNFVVKDPVTLSYSNGVLSWNKVDGASGYKVVFDSYSLYVTENSFNMASYDGAIGEIPVYVIPIFEDKSSLAPSSNIIDLNIIAPPNVTVSGAYATWSIQGTYQFDIYINGVYVETISENQYRKQKRPVDGENVLLSIVAKNNENVVSKRSPEVDISTD